MDMQNSMFRKGLVCVVIILFIGVSVLPGMSAVDPGIYSISKGTLVGNETRNDDLVEITVSFCKTDEIQNYTVMLTKEQAEELDILIDNFKKDLDKAKTKEETIALYCDMAESLYEFGLIPGGMSVEETQQLMTGGNYVVNPSEYDNIVKELKEQLSSKEKQEELISRLSDAVVKLDERGMLPGGMSVEEAQGLVTKRIHETFNNTSASEMEDILELEGNENFLCLIVGVLNYNSFFLGPAAIFLQGILKLYSASLFGELFPHLLGLGALCWIFLFILDQSNPLALANIIYMGSSLGWGSNPYGEERWESAGGWVSTLGLNGIKNWDGEFYGHLPLGTLWFIRGHDPIVYQVQYYPGVFGFTGIKILNSKTLETFFLGAALWVKIDYNTPKGFGNQQETPFGSYTSMQNSLVNQQSNQLLQQFVKTTNR